MKNYDGLWECSRQCQRIKKSCDKKECKYWINYPDDHNCTLIAIYENGRMTLRQVAERLGISFARVKQIESAALLKIKKRCNKNDIIF
jgi:DNA-directed RNA polymerase specialized sigma subunit